jgi:hypothetical protein
MPDELIVTIACRRGSKFIHDSKCNRRQVDSLKTVAFGVSVARAMDIEETTRS